MNIYVIIEGEGGPKKLYKEWIPYVNKSLKHIEYLQDFSKDNFYILAGHGQPGYWEKIGRAIDDVNNIKTIDRLVVSIDSEDSEYEGKLQEAKQYVDKLGCRVEVRYIIQYFCMETWLLGNAQIYRKNPRDKELIEYLRHFDLRDNDPAFLPCIQTLDLTRAKLAYRYLRAAIRDIYDDRKSYTKTHPGVALEPGFFYQVKLRYEKRQHIISFKDFIEAFI